MPRKELIYKIFSVQDSLTDKYTLKISEKPFSTGAVRMSRSLKMRILEKQL